MLTNREKEIIQLASNGLSSKEIAKTIGISKKTVEAHLRASRNKLEARNTVNLISIAHRSGIISSIFLFCSIITSVGIDNALRPSRARTRVSSSVRNSRPKREWEIIE